LVKRLQNKVAVVTGGSVGIGQATAFLFAEEGAKVVIANPSEPSGEQTAHDIRSQGGDAIFILADISNEDDCRRACDEAVRNFGQLNILVNNGAVFILKGLEATVADWQRMLAVNVMGTALMAKFASEHMKKAGGGSIVNLGSISSFVAQPSFITYSSTKGAILGFTRSLAKNLIEKGIRVNGVAPGPIWTPLNPSGGQRPVKIPEFGKDTPMGRPGQPNEVAPSFLFLACEDASYMTGQVLHPDGGESTSS